MTRHSPLQFSCIGQKIEQSGLILLLFKCAVLVIWGPFVTVVKMTDCSVGRGFEGSCSAAERKKEGPGSCAHSNFLAESAFFLKTSDCSFKETI